MHTSIRQQSGFLALGMSMVILLFGCSESGTGAQERLTGSSTPVVEATMKVPDDLQKGNEKFHAFCAPCHGPQGVGTDHGPPLVHKIYEPSHHADMAFQRAAAQGVRAHHWKFGNMPKIDGVTSEDVTEIIGYVRWLQKQAGIF
ncbi:MAG: cytochrome c [Nitrospirales bacterium]